MADPTIYDAIRFLAPLVGTGGATAIVVAWLGTRKPKPVSPPAPPPASIPIQIETPWLVQTLIEMKLEIEGIKKAIDGLTKAIADMSIQVNTMASRLKRRQHD